MSLDGHGSESLFHVETIRSLVDEMERSGIDELEMAEGDNRVLIRRAPSGALALDANLLESRKAQHAEPLGLPITAPLTGMFYSRPQPSDPPYVNPGDHVERGQVVALIETMKLFNEVAADVSGLVLKIVAPEGGLVEAGQPLMFLGPEKGEDG